MIKKITGILVLTGICFSVFFFFEGRYALSETVQKIEQRLDNYILEDRYNAIQERIWRIEDRYEDKKMPEIVKENLRLLKVEKTKIDIKLESNVEVSKDD